MGYQYSGKKISTETEKPEFTELRDFGVLRQGRMSRISVRLLETGKGDRYIDIRKQTLSEWDKEERWFSTKKGICLPSDAILELRKMLPEIVEGMLNVPKKGGKEELKAA